MHFAHSRKEKRREDEEKKRRDERSGLKAAVAQTIKGKPMDSSAKAPRRPRSEEAIAAAGEGAQRADAGEGAQGRPRQTAADGRV